MSAINNIASDVTIVDFDFTFDFVDCIRPAGRNFVSVSVRNPNAILLFRLLFKCCTKTQ